MTKRKKTKMEVPTLLPHHASIILAAVSGAAIGIFALINREDRRVERRLLRRNKIAYRTFEIAYLILSLSFAYNLRFVIHEMFERFKVLAKRRGFLP